MKIEKLLLTGQNNNLHGFCGVPLTAINTCEAILGINYNYSKRFGGLSKKTYFCSPKRDACIAQLVRAHDC